MKAMKQYANADLAKLTATQRTAYGAYLVTYQLWLTNALLAVGQRQNLLRLLPAVKPRAVAVRKTGGQKVAAKKAAGTKSPAAGKTSAKAKAGAGSKSKKN